MNIRLAATLTHPFCCCCCRARAKNITNKPRINEDPKDAMLREFQEEIQRLKAALTVRGMMHCCKTQLHVCVGGTCDLQRLASATAHRTVRTMLC